MRQIIVTLPRRGPGAGRRIPAMVEGRTETVGRDAVRFRGSAVVVESAADMPDWDFRDYRRTAVLFRGQQYFVAEKRLLPGGSYRYVLEPWGALVDLPGRTITYDDGYAAARDMASRDEKRRDRASAALFFVSPLLGLLSARAKLALNDRYAFDPPTVTRQSLFLERIAFYCLSTLIVLGNVARLPEAWLAGLIVLAAAVLVDMVMRTGPADGGEQEQPGFWEWAWPGWKRRARSR
jgi:hypothetical protein